MTISLDTSISIADTLYIVAFINNNLLLEENGKYQSDIDLNTLLSNASNPLQITGDDL